MCAVGFTWKCDDESKGKHKSKNHLGHEGVSIVRYAPLCSRPPGVRVLPFAKARRLPVAAAPPLAVLAATPLPALEGRPVPTERTRAPNTAAACQTKRVERDVIMMRVCYSRLREYAIKRGLQVLQRNSGNLNTRAVTFASNLKLDVLLTGGMPPLALAAPF
jgi:hypothetical protein